MSVGFRFEWYSFAYMQIISLLFINMQISGREAAENLKSRALSTLQSLQILVRGVYGL